MKELYKRSVALFLAATMLSPVIVSASSLSDILLTNSTYSGTWEDPSSGIKYATGGGIKIKFKSTSNGFAPWTKGRTPTYNVGCNGISLEGGFLALLGLDDIESQLKDAGAAFAWGILIGLAYSLPAVSDVFAKIQKWARTMQALLQNACSIGSNLTKGATGAEKFNFELQDGAIKEGFGKAKDFLDSIDTKMEAVDDFVACNGDAACKGKKGNTISHWFAEKLDSSLVDAKKNALGASSATMSKVKTAISDTGAYYKEVGLHELLKTDSTYISITEEEILNIKLALTFFGDLVLSNESRAFIAKFFNDDGTVNDDSVKSVAKEMLASSLKIEKASYELLSPQINDIAKVSELLINGSKDEIFIPNYKVGILIVPVKKDGSEKSTYTFLFKDIKTGFESHENLKFEWGGFYKEGLVQIKKALNKSKGGKADVLFAIPTNSDDVKTDKDKVPVLIPAIATHIYNLRLAVKTDSSKAFSAGEMARKLAQVNAALATNGLVSEISSRVRKASLASTSQRELFIAFLKQIEGISLNVLEEVKKTYKQDKDISTMLTDEIEHILNSSKKGALK